MWSGLRWASGGSNRGQLSGVAAGAVEEFVGFGVVDELLGFGIPLEFAVETENEVREVANGADAVADFDREVRIFAGAHAFQEVSVFAGGVGIEADFVITDF